MNRTVIAGAILALALAACGDKPADKPAAAPAPTAAPEPATAPAPAPAPTADMKPADGAAPAGAPAMGDAKPADGGAPPVRTDPMGQAPGTSNMNPEPTALPTTPTYSAEQSKQMGKDAVDKTKNMGNDTAKK